MMHVLVTGATGFLGRHFVPRLIESGHRVRALVRDPARGERYMPEAVDQQVGNLAEPATLSGMLAEVDAVVHLAAATAGDWPAQRRATVEGTANLLQACCDAHVRRFVHVSTVAVYDMHALDDGQMIAPAAALAESNPSLGPYARAKLEAELLVRRAAMDDKSIDLTIVRPGLVYGPRHVLFEHLGKPLPKLNRRLAYGSSRQRLPMVHVDSVADALMRILATPATIGQMYNLVDESDCTRLDYLAAYETAARRRERVWCLPAAPVALACDVMGRFTGLSGDKVRTRARSVRYDTSALSRDTGWSPSQRLRDTLAEAVEATPGPDGRPLRVAVVGAGMNAGYHLRPLAAHRQVQVVGIVDKQVKCAASLAETYGISLAAASLDELFERGRPDVVHLVTPPQTHAELACAVMQRGADVFCEKPLAMSADECRQMARAARRFGRSLAVNHNLWFDPRLVKARRLAAEGAMGELLHVETTRAFSPRGIARQSDARAAWLRALPGGLLEDVLPHPLYATLGFLRHQTELLHARCWSTGRRDDEADDELRIALGDGRTTANLTLSLNARPDTFTIHLYGEQGTLVIDIQNMLIHLQRPGPGPRAVDRTRLLARTSLGNLTQTAANAARLVGRCAAAPGDMTGIIHEHVQCQIDDRPFPLGAAQGEQVVDLLEQIWPRKRAGETPLKPGGLQQVPRL